MHSQGTHGRDPQRGVQPTADYDRGVYAVVRNTRTMLEEAVERYSKIEQFLTQFPFKDGEYDLTAYHTILSVVVTPHVMYVHEPLLSQTVLPGLRKYSGFEEFRERVQGFP